MKFIAKMQQEDEKLQEIKERFLERFQIEKFNARTQLLLYTGKVKENKFLIYVPLSMADDLVEWFHENLMHPGASRLVETIRQMFYVKGLDERSQRLVAKCPECQKSKVTAIQPVGKVPMRTERTVKPFETVRVDCCGPWTVEVQCKRPRKTITRQVHAVTMVDDATGWPEITQLNEKTAYHLAKKFNAQWLCRYPRPTRVICDNGGEFMGKEFQELLRSYAVEQVPTTVLNPQSNGIKERIHLTMADMLRTVKFTVKDDREGTWQTEIDTILQAVAWALRSTVGTTVKHAPSNLVFNKDMILNNEVKVNWTAIKNQRESKAMKDNQRENNKRKQHTYEEGGKCWIVKNKYERSRKLDKVAKGPFLIMKSRDPDHIPLSSFYLFDSFQRHQVI